MKPAINITGTTHGVNLAPPVNHISTRFIAISIDNMDIKDMPRAVLKAVLISIWRARIIVSNIMEVIKPLMIAKTIMERVGQFISKNWKNVIVPRSPIAQPSKHHNVL